MGTEAEETAVAKVEAGKRSRRTSGLRKKLSKLPRMPKPPKLAKLTAKLPKITPKQKKVAAAAAAAAAGVAVVAAGVAVARRRRSRAQETTVIHVLPKDDRWEVRGEGAQRATSVHETKREAVAAARQRAREREPSRLVVHRVDGSVQDSFAYGS
jgi:hypothetical protein